MTAVPDTGAESALTLDIRAGASFADRHRRAVEDVKEAFALRRLVWTLAVLDIRVRYRGSVIGPFWLSLSTAIMVAAMGFIYGNLFKIDMQDYLPFLAVSQVLWTYLSILAGESNYAFIINESIIRSVRMPFMVYAGRLVLRNLLSLAHNAVVIVGVFVIMRVVPGPAVLLAIPAFLLWVIDSVALAVLLGAVCARFRDVPQIIVSVLQMAFFVTPVIWRASLIGDLQWMLPFNPFYALLEILRGPLLGEVPHAIDYVSACLYSVLLCAASWLLFVRVRGRIAFWL